MSRLKSKLWDSAAGQMENIAKEAEQVHRSKASKTDKPEPSKPHEVTGSGPVVAPAAVEKPPQTKRTSTSLYLTPAAHRAIRMHAAEQGVRPHRIYDDALRAYFKDHGLEDFDKLNGAEL